MSHVFISYVREDAEIVGRICVELQNRGVDVWLDRERIRPGERWKDAIRTAVSEGTYFLACFSSNYASRESSFMNEELVLAIEELRLKSYQRRWFIPVLLSECEVPARSIGGGETLLDFQWIEFYTNFTQGMNRLASELNTDEVARRKDVIDDIGDVYTRRTSDPLGAGFLIESARKHYVEAVGELKRIYGITHDPIKLNVIYSDS